MTESDKHKRMKELAAQALKRKGHNQIQKEYGFGKGLRADVVALDGEKIAVEIGTLSNTTTVENRKVLFHNEGFKFIHIPYEKAVVIDGEAYATLLTYSDNLTEAIYKIIESKTVALDIHNLPDPEKFVDLPKQELLFLQTSLRKQLARIGNAISYRKAAFVLKNPNWEEDALGKDRDVYEEYMNW